MTGEHPVGFQPSKRQAALLARVSESTVSRVAGGETGFFALGGIDRVRARHIPTDVIQRAINTAFVTAQLDAQTYRTLAPDTDRDSFVEFQRTGGGLPISPLRVHAVGGQGAVEQTPLVEGMVLKASGGLQALDVYPAWE